MNYQCWERKLTLFRLIGYSPTGSAKLDPQFAIYLPYFKWDPTSRSASDEYPCLRDYAQPSIFHGALENETKTRSIPHSLPLVVHQLWLFVTGSSNKAMIFFRWDVADLQPSRNGCVLPPSSCCSNRWRTRRESECSIDGWYSRSYLKRCQGYRPDYGCIYNGGMSYASSLFASASRAHGENSNSPFPGRKSRRSCLYTLYLSSFQLTDCGLSPVNE